MRNIHIIKFGKVAIFCSALLLVFATLFFPLTSSAASIWDGVACSGNEGNCSLCDVIQLGNEVILWLVGVLFVIFGLVMIAVGFKFLTSGSNPGERDRAKKMFLNSVLGIVIVFAAWIVINTMMIGLTGGNLTLGSITTPWNQITCKDQPTLNNVPIVLYSIGDTYRGNETLSPGGANLNSLVTPAANAPGSLTQTEAEALLASGNFEIVSSGGCINKAQSNCTSLEGLQPVAANRTLELQQAVGSRLIITGATESGHALGQYSHGNGYKVDFRTTSELNSHIQNNFQSVGGNKWKDSNGNIYFRHGGPTNDHWDVTFTN